jgi:DNA modification methylase
VTPFWSDDHLTLYGGDCRAVLAELPAESVHCVVTSPPYWGLRDYGTASWDGGDEACDHERARKAIGNSPSAKSTLTTNNGKGPQPGDKFSAGSQSGFGQSCPCGARRIDSQLGLEPTPEAYVENMVAVFREVRRVLRADGTLWLNLGDSFGDKQLQGIPWRVAFALQADGWYLRSDIIWSKPNPMPESVTDRPTKAHEYLFLLSKSPRYYFDADAVREADAGLPSGNGFAGRQGGARQSAVDGGNGTAERFTPGAGRNLRSVWTIATEPYPGAHFATFPRKLVEPCVKAGTSERGVCPECGAPWVRVVAERPYPAELANAAKAHGGVGNNLGGQRHQDWLDANPKQTTGWRPTCDHRVWFPLNGIEQEAGPVPAVVLDPFAGSGTTLLVAQALGRRGMGIDLNPDYLKQALVRNAQTPLGLVG